MLAKPGSITPHKKFKGEVYVLKKEEGGRHTPFFNNYRPQFYFRTTDVTGTVTLPEGVEMVMPGDNINIDVELITPIACEEGLRFAIREGGKTVGAGVVTKILDERIRKREEGVRHGRCTRHRHARMHGLPRAQLHHDQEQARRRREARAVEVLLALPQAYGPQGNEVVEGGSITRASKSRSS